MTISEAVAKRLKLFSKKRVLTLLEGNYDSLFRGRSIDLAGLREYVPGDNIKDIDWSSTARTNVVQTKIYAAQRDQKFLIAADLSPSMLVDGRDELSKTDAVMALLIMVGTFVRQNNDQLAIIGYDGRKSLPSRYGNSSKHLERLLKSYDASTKLQGSKPDLISMLDTIRHGDRTRSAVIIISDGTPDLLELKRALNRLHKRHQLFFIHLPPNSPIVSHIPRVGLADAETGIRQTLPFMHSKRLDKEWRDQYDHWRDEWIRMCHSIGVCHESLTSADDMPQVLQTLFRQAKKYAKH